MAALSIIGNLRDSWRRRSSRVRRSRVLCCVDALIWSQSETGLLSCPTSHTGFGQRLALRGERGAFSGRVLESVALSAFRGHVPLTDLSQVHVPAGAAVNGVLRNQAPEFPMGSFQASGNPIIDRVALKKRGAFLGGVQLSADRSRGVRARSFPWETPCNRPAGRLPFATLSPHS